MPDSKRREYRLAFTLVELLVVIAIIGMLVAMLLPAVQSARSAARRTQCQNNLRQLGIALQSHESAQGVFPPGVTIEGDDFRNGQYSGLVNLLPYIEEQNLHDRFDFSGSWKDAVNLPVTMTVVESFLCPESPSSVAMDGNVPGGPSDYAFSKGPEAFLCSQPASGFLGVFDINSKIQRAHIKDGLSNTFAMGEAASSAALEATST